MMHSAAMRSEEVAREGGREAPGSLPSSAPPRRQCTSAAQQCPTAVAMTFPEVEERKEKGRGRGPPSPISQVMSFTCSLPSHSSLSRFYPSGESAPFHLWNGLVSSGLGREANFTNNLQAFCRGPSVPLHICAAHITHHLTCFRINSSFLPTAALGIRVNKGKLRQSRNNPCRTGSAD